MQGHCPLTVEIPGFGFKNQELESPFRLAIASEDLEVEEAKDVTVTG